MAEPDRRPERRHDRADRLAARALQPPRQPVRRRLSRLAADELHRRPGRPPSRGRTVTVAVPGLAGRCRSKSSPAPPCRRPATTVTDRHPRREPRADGGELTIRRPGRVVESLGRETLLYADAGALRRLRFRKPARASSPCTARARSSRRTDDRRHPLDPPRRGLPVRPRRPALCAIPLPGTAARSNDTEELLCVSARSISISTPTPRSPASARASTPRPSARPSRTPMSTASPCSPSATTACPITRPRSARCIRTWSSTCCARRSTRCTPSGINAPVYLTATWDELAAFEHPEWRTVSPDGIVADVPAGSRQRRRLGLPRLLDALSRLPRARRPRR